MTRGPGRVTIAVPVYNASKYLAKALDSALAQTYRCIDVVVFDNASTDESLAIAQAYGDQLRIEHTEVNRGAAWNFNRAVAAAKTPFFMWLAADDMLRPTFVERCMSALVEQPEAQFALSDVEYINAQGEHMYETKEDGRLGSPDVAQRSRSYLTRPRWTEVYSLYRTEELRTTRLFRPVYGTDVLLVWELLLRGPAALVPEPLLVYREYPKSVQAVMEAVTASAAWPRWPGTRIWLELWRTTKHSSVEPGVRRKAKRELLRALHCRTWLLQLIGDFEIEAARPGAFVGVRWANAVLGVARKVVHRTRRI